MDSSTCRHGPHPSQGGGRSGFGRHHGDVHRGQLTHYSTTAQLLKDQYAVRGPICRFLLTFPVPVQRGGHRARRRSTTSVRTRSDLRRGRWSPSVTGLLAGTTAIVTGASRDIRAAVAEGLLEVGAKIGSSNAATLDELATRNRPVIGPEVATAKAISPGTVMHLCSPWLAT